MSRQSGVLLPLFSLPSPCGVGTLGRAACDFLDRLHEAGQSWWQLLPLGPTGYGDSPYQSLSSQAGNPYFIDLELLAEEGLLSAGEIGGDWGGDPEAVDYGVLFRRREEVLALAWERLKESAFATLSQEFAAFVMANREWLEDYALYAALKREFDHKPWYEWPEPLRCRHGWAMEQARAAYGDSIDRQRFYQFLFFRQWRALRQYAAGLDIKLMGDLPLYCAWDSADVWAAPDQFQLDAAGKPLAVAGCPPDDFTPDGQLWGNPLYNWDDMRADGFAWWRRRLRCAARLFDGLRLDHFRGLEAYWSIPWQEDGSHCAADGSWQKGPGEAFLRAMGEACPDTLIIAEDLGFLTPQVQRLREAARLPGMKVLEFAFGDGDSAYLPHNHEKNCVCYAGTHDNPPLLGWIAEAEEKELALARDYLDLPEDCSDLQLARAVLRAGFSSVASLFILQLQDLLELDDLSRINRPGSDQGNWRWRLQPGQFGAEEVKRLARLTRLYGRWPGGK
ncbi:MAG: 4-alpha-glucanotransferase [Firmicutes bacterium]|nr:4-alpha-glucanotransferase [Bacillota bacterium]